MRVNREARTAVDFMVMDLNECGRTGEKNVSASDEEDEEEEEEEEEDEEEEEEVKEKSAAVRFGLASMILCSLYTVCLSLNFVSRPN